MKHYITLFLVAMLLCFNCQNDDSTQAVLTISQLTEGKWRLETIRINTDGALEESPDYPQELEIKLVDTTLFVVEDFVEAQGRYRQTQSNWGIYEYNENNALNVGWKYWEWTTFESNFRGIDYDNFLPNFEIIEVTNDTLVLNIQAIFAFDYIHKYSRLQ